MILIDEDDVHRNLPYGSLIKALCTAHEQDVDDVRSEVLEQPSAEGGRDHFLALPAWQRGKALAAKLVTVFPANEHNGSGLPSVQGVVVLFDGRNGKPRAVIDGAAITLRKTAADSGMGGYFLASPGAQRLLMVGAGAMAPHLIQAHMAARPSIAQVSIWNRSRPRAEDLVARMALLGVNACVADDLEAAARAADVISCATMATQPLIEGAWLKPGAHLDLVGSYRTDMRECDDAALAGNSVFVDSPWSAVQDSGEFAHAAASGAFQISDIRATAFDLARGQHPGRTSTDEITVYKNGGGGHLDLMVARILAERIG